MTTALAFLHFARQNVDAAVIEVGLGGRLDATNIVTPRVSVITSLSLDHTAVLGDTLTDISGEKAGIIKPGRPVVSAPQDDEALVVLERIAAERRAPLTIVGRDLTFTSLNHSLDGQRVRVSMPGDEPVILGIPLLGSHQAENAAVAYAALQVFQREGLLLETAHIQKGFAQAKWPGRFEVVRSNPPLVLDSAHNRYSAGKLRQTLDEYFPEWPVILIFGASEDKNVADMLAELAPRLERVVLTQAEHPRALEPEKLLPLAEQAGVEAEAVTPVEAAVARALELAGQRALVLSAGSIFVTAAVRAVLNKK
ncbi:MAG: bifunctional folylpolyglutamate synthase/dihydrofolate synthase [Chloroflexi bacterium]|nr:bifunctional folylpolyglutamate synthase/dihydrofolate synthase [Chloroflexota bacterium]